MNENIIKEFKKLVEQIKFEIDSTKDKKEKTKQMFRLSSINKSIKAITNIKEKIKDISQVVDTKDIGTGTINRINEILKTGKLSEIKEDVINNEYLKYLEELEKVFGIGRKKALELYKLHNVRSIAELKKKYKEGKIELPDNIVKGLKYYDKIKENIPRKEIDEVNLLLQSEIKSIDNKLNGVICGSYRRLNITSNDIDFLLTHPSYKKKNDLIETNYLELLVNKLKHNGYIVESLTDESVKSKYMGLFKLHKKSNVRRIDIRFVPQESFYYAMLYFTGSKDFNKMTRQLAIDHGWLLNEYGMFDDDGSMFKVKSEKEIFELLGLEYIPPEKR